MSEHSGEIRKSEPGGKGANVVPTSTIDVVSALEIRLSQMGGGETQTQSQAEIPSIVSAFLAQLLKPEHGKLHTEDLDEVLQTAASTTHGTRGAAFILMRLVGDERLATNKHIIERSRNIVAAVEVHLPDISRTIEINTLRQTHEKYARIQRFHQTCLEHLGPFKGLSDDLDSVAAFRQTAMSIVNNGRYKQYLALFSSEDLGTFFEASFKKIIDFRDCSMDEFPEKLLDALSFFSDADSEISSVPTFLTEIAIGPFVRRSLSALRKIEEASRGRFITSIESGISQKRYPLQEVEHTFKIRLPFKCLGPGSALNVRLTVEASDELYIPTAEVELGQVSPGAFSALVEVIVFKSAEKVTILTQVEWSEVGNNERKVTQGTFEILAQQAGKDWAALQYERPYSTEPATGESFVGRRERVIRIASHLLRNPIVSFYITGQKRIGKTSLALASADFAQSAEVGNVVRYHYLQWGSFAHEDPRQSLRDLGEQLLSFLREYIVGKDDTLDALTFEGSLSALTRVSALLQQQRPGEKFIVILDEFDELHPELYRQGRLAEAFFANLRALSATGNIGFVLVGGENMPFVMDRQGQKLNKFIKEPLDYYSRASEWEDYVTLIREPTAGKLTWHDDAIAEVFVATNGNPFFSKIVCGGVYAAAVAERDVDVTAYEVTRSLDREIAGFDVNSFAHLWQDGASNLEGAAEIEILKRSRTLVAIGRTLRLGQGQRMKLY